MDVLLRRIDELERRIEAVDHHVEAARWPSGPVYAGDGTAIVATRWGGKLYVDCGDAVLAPWLLLDGLWESSATGWFQQVVRPGHHVVDIGANIGYFTVLSAKLAGPSGRVVAFEANPRLRQLAARNLAANGVHGHAEVHHLAAWSESTEVVLHVRRHFSVNSSVAPSSPAFLEQVGDEASEPVTVQAVAVDDVLGDLPRVDVLKIDVEGAEVRVLRGLARTLKANDDVKVLCEWAPAAIEAVGDDPEEALDVFRSLDWAAKILGDDGIARPVSWDEVRATGFANLVLARS